MRSNRRQIIALKASFWLGSNMLGVFLPFLVMKAFDLNIGQVLWWAMWFFIGITVLIYPINYLLSRKYSQQRILQFGLASYALFIGLLSIPNQNQTALIIATFGYILFICLFWPHFNYQVQHAAPDNQRGDFMSNVQVMIMTSNLVAPIITGYLLDQGLQKYIILVALLFMGLAVYFSNNINIQEQKISSKKIFSKYLKSLPITTKMGITADGIHSGLLWMVWPIYLQLALTKFTLMGVVTSIAGGVEIITAKIAGKFVDKKSFQKLRWPAIISRMIDLWNRIWLWFFPSFQVVTSVAIAGAFLGPIFGIPFMKRHSQVADEQNQHSVDFWLGRELMLNSTRAVFMGIAAFSFSLWGVASLWWLFGIAGLSILGLYKY